MNSGYFNYIQRKLEDIFFLDLKDIIDLEVDVNNGEVEYIKEVNIYSLKTIYKDRNSKMFRVCTTL